MGGFFGVTAKHRCIDELFYGVDYNSHMGTKRAGMVTVSDGIFTRSIHNIENNYFRTKFQNELADFKGNSGIGVISDTDAQPIIVNCHLGKFAIVTVARINNISELEKKLLAKGHHFCEHSYDIINPTEMIASLISEGKDLVGGIENVYNEMRGSCSMLLLLNDGRIVAARDRLGRTPIQIARKDDAYAASSESCSFPNLGFELCYELGPGEIVELTPDGIKQLRKPNEEMQICSFLWTYYGYPTASYEGVNVEVMRTRNGEIMAENDIKAGRLPDVDYVCGIPDSGTPHAIGYANRSGIPFARPFIKYTPTWPRSFMPTNQNIRNQVAKMKLIPVHELIAGKKLLFVDDSIVRGTQMRETVEFLYENGAKEIHMRSACPPIMYGCKYLNFSRSTSEMELIARQIINEFEGVDGVNYISEYSSSDTERGRKLRDEICKRLKLTSLEFQTLEGTEKAVGLPECGLCSFCWSGRE